MLRRVDWELLTFRYNLPAQSSKANQSEASACPLQMGSKAYPDTPVTARRRGVNNPEERRSKAILF